ncbi:hypothetical protein BGZ47_002339 [Haplosporangium gracile]|nr:hypothetical protein BGZ47_002339 [Haplosporangium gracile]
MLLPTTGDGPLKSLAIIQLRSFILYQPTHWIGRDELPEPIPSLLGLSTIQHHRRSLIPLPDYENLDAVPFWELVRDNPGLQYLEVRTTLPCDHSSLPNRQPSLTPDRTFDSPAGQVFVRTILESTAELQTLQLHLCYHTFPLRTLRNLSRTTEMTISKYGELHGHDLDGVHSDTLHRIPNLQEPIAMDNSIYDSFSVTDQRMVHSRLKPICLSADSLVGLPISLPSLKHLHPVETIPHHLDFLGDLLDQFPSLEHLDATLWSLTIE